MSPSACVSEPLESGKRQTRAALAGLTALVLAMLLLPAWPAAAKAASTVTLGPSLPTAESPDGAGLECFSAPECTYFTEHAGAFTVPAPAPGTITSWSVEEFSGSAELVVLQPEAGGAYSVVAQSAKESEPCMSNPNNNYCIPHTAQVYTFQTDLPIVAGQVIGIDVLNPPGCEGDMPIDCTIIGDVAPGDPQDDGSQAYLDPTPAPNTPTVPTSDSIGPFTVDAVEQTTATAPTEPVKTPTEAERLKEIEECPPASEPASQLTAPIPPTPPPSPAFLARPSGTTPLGKEPPEFCQHRTKYSAAEKKRAGEWNAYWSIESSNFAIASAGAGGLALAAGLIPEPVASKGIAAGETGAALFAAAVSAYYNREAAYMSVIVNDPPDPNWRTIASAPPTHPGSLPKVPGLSKRGQQAFASYMGARLTNIADAECESEAINRATTALANEDDATAAAQYRAGAACAAADVQTIKASGKLNSKVKLFVPVLERDVKAAAGERSLSKQIATDERNPKLRQKAATKTIASLDRLVTLPALAITSLQAELSKKVTAPHVRQKEIRKLFATPSTEGAWQVLQEQAQQTMAAAGAL